MSTPKSQFERARVILDSLMQGIHPKSGSQLPEDSIVNEIDVNRAMAAALLALDQVSARLARRAQLPKSVGKPWTEEEDRALRDEFLGGDPIPLVAIKHGRTIRAIEARLEKLGLLTSDQKVMHTSFTTSTGPKDKA